MRMLKRYLLVQAGNTIPAMTSFSDAIVLRDGDATRKEAISRFVGDINDYAHASILHHLKTYLPRSTSEYSRWQSLKEVITSRPVRPRAYRFDSVS